MTRPSKEEVGRALESEAPYAGMGLTDSGSVLAAEVLALREELDKLRGAYVVERGKNEFPLPHYPAEAVDALRDAWARSDGGAGGLEEIAAAFEAVAASREPRK